MTSTFVYDVSNKSFFIVIEFQMAENLGQLDTVIIRSANGILAYFINYTLLKNISEFQTKIPVFYVFSSNRYHRSSCNLGCVVRLVVDSIQRKAGRMTIGKGHPSLCISILRAVNEF